MFGARGAHAWHRYAWLVTVVGLIALVGAGCGKKQDTQDATQTDINEPPGAVPVAEPSPPPPQKAIPQSEMQDASERFGGMKSSLLGCAGGGHLRHSGALRRYLKDMFRHYRNEAYAGRLNSRGFIPFSYGGDSGIDQSGPGGGGCLSQLGNSILGLAGLGDAYGDGGMGNYLNDSVAWVFDRVRRQRGGGGYGSGYGYGY